MCTIANPQSFAYARAQVASCQQSGGNVDNLSVPIYIPLPEVHERRWSVSLLLLFGLAGCVLWLLFCLIGVSVVLCVGEAQRRLRMSKTASSNFGKLDQ